MRKQFYCVCVKIILSWVTWMFHSAVAVFLMPTYLCRFVEASFSSLFIEKSVCCSIRTRFVQRKYFTRTTLSPISCRPSNFASHIFIELVIRRQVLTSMYLCTRLDVLCSSKVIVLWFHFHRVSERCHGDVPLATAGALRNYIIITVSIKWFSLSNK